MVKKLFIISTAAMIMFSPMAFARGGNAGGGKGKAYSGSLSQGTASQVRTRINSQTKTRTKLGDGSGKTTSGTKGSGDMIRDRKKDKLQDGSCNE